MKLAFYIADNGKFYDKLINVWTGNYGYSHVELVFSDGVSFSASNREGKVRFKEIHYDPKRWVIINLSFSRAEELAIRKAAIKLINKKYDWKGVLLHQFIGRIIGHITSDYDIIALQSKNKWWCSEIVAFLLGFRKFRIHPNKLAEKYKIPKR